MIFYVLTGSVGSSSKLKQTLKFICIHLMPRIPTKLKESYRNDFVISSLSVILWTFQFALNPRASAFNSMLFSVFIVQLLTLHPLGSFYTSVVHLVLSPTFLLLLFNFEANTTLGILFVFILLSCPTYSILFTFIYIII